jgi:hypothetical protein
MLESIARIFDNCGLNNAVLPPTVLYNEGWMLRLVLDWFDRHRDIDHELNFTPEACWFSEGLLHPPFLPRFRGDINGESYTHADGIIGQFTVGSRGRGYVRLKMNVRQLVVIEAKIGSNLSSGTRNAPQFDQAARIVACMANLLEIGKVNPASLERLAFYVIAPESQRESFNALVNKKSIEQKVRERVDRYNNEPEMHAWFEGSFLVTLGKIDLGTLSWDEILAFLPTTFEVRLLREFYEKCLVYNPMKATKASKKTHLITKYLA